MKRYHLEPPLAPRNRRVLWVICITRISTLNQDPKSLADQQALLKRWVEDRYEGPVEWKFISGQGSGECLDRQQVCEAEELVASGQCDLVIMEDLGRHMRRMQAFMFCEACEDAGTRLVAINDNIDTALEWRLNALFAAMKHEQSNKDTSQRIKRTLRNRFIQGGVVQCPIFGYIKPPGTKSDQELQKDPGAEPIYQEWFRRLDEGASFSEVADLLNTSGVSPGPYCRRKEWNGQMVARITYNPILKGIRVRNRVKSRRLNKTGKYRSVKAAPEDRLERCCAHLAFFEADYYDRVTKKVAARNAVCKPGRPAGSHPCLGRPRKRTVWPGQHIYCGICGRLLCYGGHGQNHHLLCRGAYEYRCWMSVTVDGPDAAAKISDAVLREIASLPEFDALLIGRVREEAEQIDSRRGERLREIGHAEEKCDRAIGNVVAALRDMGSSAVLQAELVKLDEQKAQLAAEREEVKRLPRRVIEIPSAEVVRELTRQSFTGLARDSQEFGRLMRRLIPEIKVYPHQLVDGGKIVLRARFTLNLAPLVAGAEQFECLTASLSRPMQVDLFDPPQRARFREQVVALRAESYKEREVAKELGITQPAVQYAAALDRLMKARGLKDPYLPIVEPPMNGGKLRSHLHPRYRFEPLPPDSLA